MGRTMSQDKCYRKNDCIACGHDSLYLVLDMGFQPLANSFKKNKDDLNSKFFAENC